MEFTGQLEFENSDLREGMVDYLGRKRHFKTLIGDMGNIFSKFRRDLLTVFGVQVGQGVTT